ncbi:DUF4097 family beta strand repeat-containing protein [Lapidilactobacillus gannanensis]|uniref:DUF4097 family beta strand repeat-containing protein n=1 Tax=Lapidilactobacillus gannanensis TaxID=2486002 RepID=A0ABW4BMY6_9LACO|nr:DUF4097 family beta strand repeat-containing protein [Lapidilactobacillus gannanensis]
MKKTITILVSFMSLILGSVLLAGCTNNSENFTERDYHASNKAVTSVKLDVRDRQIKVVPSVDQQIHIAYSESDQEYYKIAVSAQHTLTMTSASNKKWTDYIGLKTAAKSRKIVLQVPNKLLTTLKITTNNSNLKLAPLTVKRNISLSTQNGNLTFDKLNAGKAIKLQAKNGNITGSVLGSYDDYAITTTIKKGNSNLPANKKGGVKKLIVANNNGNIDVELVKK